MLNLFLEEQEEEEVEENEEEEDERSHTNLIIHLWEWPSNLETTTSINVLQVS